MLLTIITFEDILNEHLKVLAIDVSLHCNCYIIYNLYVFLGSEEVFTLYWCGLLLPGCQNN